MCAPGLETELTLKILVLKKLIRAVIIGDPEMDRKLSPPIKLAINLVIK